MTYWTTQHFKALQKAWYQRLKDAGFEDAEELANDEMILRQKAEHVYRNVDAFQCETKETYYHFVAQMVQVTCFRNEVDRVILVSHAAGKKPSQICVDLKEAGFRRCRASVRYRIRIYEMKWGLRSYTPKQLNRKAG